MARTILITGSASGIGRAVLERVRKAGDHAIGVDLHDAEIQADLGTEAGRQAMLERVSELAPNGLDGVLAGAGISSLERAADTLSINFFGAVATLQGLRPFLCHSRRPRAVAMCSTAAMLPSDEATVAACLAGNEALARKEIAARPQHAYATSKRALSLWLRRVSTRREWAGAGVLLNGVAPGVVETPMTTPLLSDPNMMELIRQSNPIAVERFANGDEIAELIAYLLGFEGHYLLGQIIFCDGGSDAILRPDRL